MVDYHVWGAPDGGGRLWLEARLGFVLESCSLELPFTCLECELAEFLDAGANSSKLPLTITDTLRCR
jgi:hypothetical protein